MKLLPASRPKKLVVTCLAGLLVALSLVGVRSYDEMRRVSEPSDDRCAQMRDAERQTAQRERGERRELRGRARTDPGGSGPALFAFESARTVDDAVDDIGDLSIEGLTARLPLGSTTLTSHLPVDPELGVDASVSRSADRLERTLSVTGEHVREADRASYAKARRRVAEGDLPIFGVSLAGSRRELQRFADSNDIYDVSLEPSQPPTYPGDGSRAGDCP